MVGLKGRDLVTTQDWSEEEIVEVLERAKELKKKYRENSLDDLLDGMTFFMLFYNPSTRTRASFEAAMTALGGHAPFVDVSTTRVGEGEDPKDMAKVYERYGEGLGLRILEEAVDYVYGRGNDFLRSFAENCDIPVISMADDKFHPCQGLADLLTVEELVPDYEGKEYVISWAYSDKNRSWCSVQEEALIMSRFGMDVTIAAPEEFGLDGEVMDTCRDNARDNDREFKIVHDMDEALEGAHIVFPRSWVSHDCMMNGMEEFGKKKELKLHEEYKDWKLTKERFRKMDEEAIMTHVMPVFRGQEAVDEVVDSERSVIYHQAENRLHAQMGILDLVMGQA